MLHGSMLTQTDHYFPFVKYCVSYFKCLIPPHPPTSELTQAPSVNDLRSLLMFGIHLYSRSVGSGPSVP